jgi:hypothetical protein
MRPTQLAACLFVAAVAQIVCIVIIFNWPRVVLQQTTTRRALMGFKSHEDHCALSANLKVLTPVVLFGDVVKFDLNVTLSACCSSSMHLLKPSFFVWIPYGMRARWSFQFTKHPEFDSCPGLFAGFDSDVNLTLNKYEYQVRGSKSCFQEHIVLYRAHHVMIQPGDTISWNEWDGRSNCSALQLHTNRRDILKHWLTCEGKIPLPDQQHQDSCAILAAGTYEVAFAWKHEFMAYRISLLEQDHVIENRTFHGSFQSNSVIFTVL